MIQKKNSPNLRKSTINDNSPGSYQEDDKHTNLDFLRNWELSAEDADETAMYNKTSVESVQLGKFRSLEVLRF